MKPSKQELERLYLDEQKTTRQIGRMCQVSKTSVIRWLNGYYIPKRPSSFRVTQKGGIKPSAQELRRLVYELDYSYPQIAKKCRCDASLVGLWLDEYGIPRPTSLRHRNFIKSKLDQAILYNLYVIEQLSTVAIATKYDTSQTVIRSILKDYGIQSRPDGWRGEFVKCDDGHLVKSTYEMKVDNWLFQNNIEHKYEPRLPFNRRFKADFWANGWYIEIWGVTNSESYKKRKTRKILGYQAANLPLIQIPAHAFDSQRNSQWIRLLSKVNQSLLNVGLF